MSSISVFIYFNIFDCEFSYSLCGVLPKGENGEDLLVKSGSASDTIVLINRTSGLIELAN